MSKPLVFIIAVMLVSDLQAAPPTLDYAVKYKFAKRNSCLVTLVILSGIAIQQLGLSTRWLNYQTSHDWDRISLGRKMILDMTGAEAYARLNDHQTHFSWLLNRLEHARILKNEERTEMREDAVPQSLFEEGRYGRLTQDLIVSLQNQDIRDQIFDQIAEAPVESGELKIIYKIGGPLVEDQLFTQLSHFQVIDPRYDSNLFNLSLKALNIPELLGSDGLASRHHSLRIFMNSFKNPDAKAAADIRKILESDDSFRLLNQMEDVESYLKGSPSVVGTYDPVLRERIVESYKLHRELFLKVLKRAPHYKDFQ